MHHYGRALAVLDVIEGVSSADQEELDKNRVLVLLNLAAGHVELKEFGAAAKRCTEVLHFCRRLFSQAALVVVSPMLRTPRCCSGA